MQKSVKTAGVIGIVILVILGIAIIISSYSLYSIQDEVAEQEQEKEALMIQVSDLEKMVQQLQAEVESLQSTEADALQSALWILAKEDVLSTGAESNTNEILRTVSAMDASPRKTATIASLILSLKKPRFRLGGHSLAYGFDSPEWANFVLELIDKKVEKTPNVFLSETMMETFTKVDSPQVGDLMFFDGNPGNFVLFYLGTSDSGSPGIGVGHLSRSQKAGIYDTKTFTGRFLGYYRY